MNELQNKKISVLLILFSILGLLTSFLIKQPYDYSVLEYFEKNNMSMPLTEYYVDVLFIKVNLQSLSTFLILLFGLGLYSLIYKNDETLKVLINSKVTSMTGFFRTKFKQVNYHYFKVTDRKQFLENDKNMERTKPRFVIPSQKKVLLFMLLYIWPIFLTIILARDYLDKPFSEIEALNLEISMMEKAQVRTQIFLTENFDYTTVFKNTFYKANLFSELREYKNLNYISQLLNLCGTSSLTQSDKELLKQYSSYSGLLQIPKTNDKTNTYENLAYFTVIFIIVILLLILKRYRKHYIIKWLIYMLIFYCVVHIVFIQLSHTTQKSVDKVLQEKFKEGCFS